MPSEERLNSGEPQGPKATFNRRGKVCTKHTFGLENLSYYGKTKTNIDSKTDIIYYTVYRYREKTKSSLISWFCSCAKLDPSTTLVAAMPCRLDISSENFNCLGSISLRAASTLQRAAKKWDRTLLLSAPYHADWTDLMKNGRFLKTFESSGVRE